MNPRLLPLLLATGCITGLPDVEQPCARWEEPGLYRFPIDPEDTQTRKPYVYVPDSKGPRDIVVMLHGGGMNGQKMSEGTQFISLANKEGFVVVFPNGRPWPLRYWSAGPDYEQKDSRPDDVAFLDQLVAELSPKVCGDKVLAAGFSNGGMMAHRWGCEGKYVDAVVAAEGTLMSDPADCVGDPIPVRHYHGLADEVVPWEGGIGDTVRDVVFTSVEETLDVWRERNGCTDAEPLVESEGNLTCTSWSCAVPTEQCLIEGWGHLWPGGANAGRVTGNATIDAWNFLVDAYPTQVGR